jgi:hypothetical protein
VLPLHRLHGRAPGGETGPLLKLKRIHTAQSLYRESKDKAGRYGTLADLRRPKLIGRALGTGTKAGFVFDVHPSTTTSELLRSATARPERLTPEGPPIFFTNQAGVVHYKVATKPDDLAAVAIEPETAAAPSGWTPVGE